MTDPRPAVVWDLEGTLVRFEFPRGEVDRWARRLGDQLAERGWSGPLHPLIPSLERALDELSERTTETEDRRLRAMLYAELDEWEFESLRSVRVIPKAASVLEAWSQRRIPQAVVSGYGAPVVGQALERLAEWAAKRRVADLDIAGILPRRPGLRQRPSAEALSRALEELVVMGGVVPTDLVVLGDSRATWTAAASLDERVELRVWALACIEGAFSWPDNRQPQGAPATPLGLLTRLGLWSGAG